MVILQKYVNHLKQELATAENKIKSNDEVKKLNVEIGILKSEIDELKDINKKIDKQLKEKNKIKFTNSQLKENNETLTKKLNAALALSRSEKYNMKIDKRLNVYKNETIQLRQKYKRLKSEHEKLIVKIVKLNDEKF